MTHIAGFDALLGAWRKAARGKRGRAAAARFERRLADRLLCLEKRLLSGEYSPGAYRHFHIHEPKRRRVSAAPFEDRVVHHALVAAIEPRFERLFLPDSFANRQGLGTHRAVDALQRHARTHRYCLRLDVVKHFAAVDHALLLERLARSIPESDVMELVARIVATGRGVLDDEYRQVYFPGDDLLAACRPRGLPIGNLTSQFWSNCYLHPLDLFVRRTLGCRAYVRYVDDLALFADDKGRLREWRGAIIERLARLRLTVHERSAQAQPVTAGIPWLGFVVTPQRRRVKARKVRNFTRRLAAHYDAFCQGRSSFAELDASVGGWVNHVAQADTLGLRAHVLGRFDLAPGLRLRSGS